MKYSRDLPPTTDRDFSVPAPVAHSWGRVIAGLCVLVGLFSWPALILTMGAFKP